MVPLPRDLRHPEEGSCDATLPSGWELLVCQPNEQQRGAVAMFPRPVHPPLGEEQRGEPDTLLS
jgi:hypothetical protein